MEISTGQKAVVVICSWEGNRRSSTATALRHRLRNIWARWPHKGKNPPRLIHMSKAPF